MCVGPVADSFSSRTNPFHSFPSGGLFSPPVHSLPPIRSISFSSHAPPPPPLSLRLAARRCPPTASLLCPLPLPALSIPSTLLASLHTEAIGSHYVDGDDDSVEWRSALLPAPPPLQGLPSASSPPAETQALIVLLGWMRRLSSLCDLLIVIPPVRGAAVLLFSAWAGLIYLESVKASVSKHCHHFPACHKVTFRK